MRKHKLRLGIVTTYPPGVGSLNEYALHFVRAFSTKPEVAELLLLVDALQPINSITMPPYTASLVKQPCQRQRQTTGKRPYSYSLVGVLTAC